jgi:glycerophosphoryl diester phosphodiesterase
VGGRAPAGFDPAGFPIVVGHRGSAATHPENTLPSFQAAIDAGADAVELDVRVSADAVAVVLHDADVGRTTNGSGLVHELTLAELKRLDASGGRGGTVEVPTLGEVLELASGRAAVNLEIKNLPGEPGFDGSVEAAVEAALGDLERVGFSGPVLVTSFNWSSIERSRVLAPDLPTGFLSLAAVAPVAALDYVRQAGHPFVLPNVLALRGAGPEFVDEAHRHGVRVGTWTVDDSEAVAELFAWGVDAVATNDPAAAVAVRPARG